jgi:hypothetical protein
MISTRNISTAHTTKNQHIEYVVKIRKNSLLGVVALCARMPTSLHTGPLLGINCPIPTSLLVPTPTPIPHQPSTTYI